MEVTLRSVRMAHRLTYQQMADSLGIIRTTYQNYEIGRNRVPVDVRATMLQKYNALIEECQPKLEKRAKRTNAWSRGIPKHMHVTQQNLDGRQYLAALTVLCLLEQPLSDKLLRMPVDDWQAEIRRYRQNVQ